MSFTISLSPSEQQFQAEDNENILDAALRQNIHLPYGCRNGQCGACRATLTAGQVVYPNDKPSALDNTPESDCLLCQAVATSDLQLTVTVLEASEQVEPRILPCRVDQIDHLAHDVVRLYLKLPDNQRLQFLAGQYLDFLLSDGRRRAFSIANAPHDDERIELHIRHVPGGKFTDYVFSKMEEKAILRIQAPLGGFHLQEQSERPIILMGGGTGFAPLKGMIEHAFYTGLKNPMHLYWGVRSKRDLYLAELPERWAAEQPHFRFTPVLSEPDADWTGQTGWVHEAVVADYPDLSSFDLYMSGPPPMIHAAQTVFAEHQLPREQLFSDAFEYAAPAEGAS